MSRVFKKKGSYWVDYKDVQGIRHRKKVGNDKRIAKEVLNDILGKVARRVHLGVVEESKISFADFTKIWMDRVFPTLSPQTVKRWEGIIEDHLKPAFPGLLRSILPSQVEAYRTKRLEAGRTPSTLNIEITVLKHLFTRAVVWEYITNNLMKGVKKMKEPPGRTRWLDPEEIGRLLSACTMGSFPKDKKHTNRAYSPLLKHYLKPFIIFSLNSGMRRGEVLSLTRRNIDGKNRIATLEKTKNGEVRHVPLNDGAIMALKSIPLRLDTEQLFPFSGNQVGSAIRRAIRRAGISNFRGHDLRHTFASHQAMNGVQGRGIQQLLGHKDGRMTMRYSHLSDVYLRNAVDGVVLGVE